MSITDSINSIKEPMTEEEFKNYMNAPLPHNNQGYVQRDYKKEILFVMCPHCGKKNFSITEETRIHKLPWKCKASGCKKEFEVNI